jgi:hypothetical protein
MFSVSNQRPPPRRCFSTCTVYVIDVVSAADGVAAGAGMRSMTDRFHPNLSVSTARTRPGGAPADLAWTADLPIESAGAEPSATAGTSAPRGAASRQCYLTPGDSVYLAAARGFRPEERPIAGRQSARTGTREVLTTDTGDEMSDTGGIFKRCGCLDPTTRRRWGERCPRLPEPEHGSWYFACSIRDLLGRAERVRRGGFPSERAARAARDELMQLSCEERTGQNWTVKRWLQYWIAGRTRIRPTTTANYTNDIRRFLIPVIGGLTLAELTTRQLTAAFAEIGRATNRYGQRHTVCTLQHLHRTLRAALNAAVRDGVLVINPAVAVELPARERPHAVV